MDSVDSEDHFEIRRFQEHVDALSKKLDTRSPERRILYLISELGEVVDEVIELTSASPDSPEEMLAGIRERLGQEIYDVIWNAVDLANLLAIDLEPAFQKKIAHNNKRFWSRSGKLGDET